MKEFNFSLRLTKEINEMLDKEIDSMNQDKITKISKNNFISEAIFEKIQKNNKRPNCSAIDYQSFIHAMTSLKAEKDEKYIMSRIFGIPYWVKNEDDICTFLHHIQFRFLQKDLEDHIKNKFIKVYFPEIMQMIQNSVDDIREHVQKIYETRKSPKLCEVIEFNIRDGKGLKTLI